MWFFIDGDPDHSPGSATLVVRFLLLVQQSDQFSNYVSVDCGNCMSMKSCPFLCSYSTYQNTWSTLSASMKRTTVDPGLKMIDLLLQLQLLSIGSLGGWQLWVSGSLLSHIESFWKMPILRLTWLYMVKMKDLEWSISYFLKQVIFAWYDRGNIYFDIHIFQRYRGWEWEYVIRW